MLLLDLDAYTMPLGIMLSPAVGVFLAPPESEGEGVFLEMKIVRGSKYN